MSSKSKGTSQGLRNGMAMFEDGFCVSTNTKELPKGYTEDAPVIMVFRQGQWVSLIEHNKKASHGKWKPKKSKKRKHKNGT